MDRLRPLPKNIIDLSNHLPEEEELDNPQFEEDQHLVESAEDEVAKKERKQRLDALYQKFKKIITSKELWGPLTFDERRVLKKRFGIKDDGSSEEDGERTSSLRRVGVDLSYSPQNIFRIEMRALTKLRELLTDEDRELIDSED